MLELQSDSVETAVLDRPPGPRGAPDLLRRLAGRQHGRGNELSAGNFERRAAEVADRAEILRSALDRGEAAADAVRLTP